MEYSPKDIFKPSYKPVRRMSANYDSLAELYDVVLLALPHEQSWT